MLSIMRFKVFFSRYVRILQNDKFVHRQKNGVLYENIPLLSSGFFIYTYIEDVGVRYYQILSR